MSRAVDRSIESKWEAIYLAAQEQLNEGLAEVMVRPRFEALQTLLQKGIPARGARGGESYLYTDLRSWFEQYDHIAMRAELPEQQQSVCPSAIETPHRVRLVGGFISSDAALVRFDSGVVYGSLAVAAREHPELVERCYGAALGSVQDASVAFSTLFAQDGLFLYVPKGVVLAEPILLESISSGSVKATATFARHLLIVEERAQVSVVIDHRSEGEIATLTTQTREIQVGAGAELTLTEVAQQGGSSALICNSYARQERDSRFRSLYVALGGAMLRSTQQVDLCGEGAENQTDAVQLAAEQEHFDITTTISHLSADCISRERVKGVSSGCATSAFAGRVYVAQDAQRTEAYQQNQNLLLSEQAHIYTKPQLEIYADDVKCSHGATVGQLDDQAIYYMRQRGLSAQQARRLQMQGFACDLLASIPSEELRERISDRVEQKIERM